MQITHSFSSRTQLVESLNYRKRLASLTKMKKRNRKKKSEARFLSNLVAGWVIVTTNFPSPPPFQSTLKWAKRWEKEHSGHGFDVRDQLMEPSSPTVLKGRAMAGAESYNPTGQPLWRPQGHTDPEEKSNSDEVGKGEDMECFQYQLKNKHTPNFPCHHCPRQFMFHCPGNLWDVLFSYQ